MVSGLRLAVAGGLSVSALTHAWGAEQRQVLGLLLVLSVVWAAAALAMAVREKGAATTSWRWVAVDLSFLSALTYAAGGADSELDLAFTLPAAVAAVLGRARSAAILLVATLALYSAAAAADALDRGVGWAALWPQLGEASFRGALILVLALIVGRRQARTEARAAASQRLVGQVMVDEEAVRRELASELHDVHLQNLYAAQFELESREGTDESLALASGLIEGTLVGLRDRVAELYPATLEHAGLEAAVRELAARRQVATSASITTSVDPDVPRDARRMAFACAREFLVNASTHAGADATHIHVAIAFRESWVTVVATDDGQGFEDGARSTALKAGHIGLASLQDRLEALGGSLALTRGDEVGAVATAAWPTSGPPGPDSDLELFQGRAREE